MHKEAGFTLIEVIVTLIIAGILASIAGMGIVQGIKGYVFALENSAITQKAELAMARMSLELRDVSDVTEVTDTPITITYTKDSSSYTIALSGDKVKINDNTLIGGVNSLNLTYYYKESEKSTELIKIDDPVDVLVARIDIELILQHTEGNITFKTTINPRNIF